MVLFPHRLSQQVWWITSTPKSLLLSKRNLAWWLLLILPAWSMVIWNIRSMSTNQLNGLVRFCLKWVTYSTLTNASFSFCFVCLGELADLIFVFFDPIGQALCKRTLNLVEQLNIRHPERLRFYLSKADEAGTESDRQRFAFSSSFSYFVSFKPYRFFFILIKGHDADRSRVM